ncbi:hypothetical protein GW17_00018538 [Ensete ventricosum]|nr:hypothetical protein GW17_00018538 [Ensete ventricosum]
MFHREGREISQKAKGAESGRREERACRFLTERASSTSDFCDIGSSGVGIQSDAYVLQKMTLGHEHHNAASSSPPPPLLQERASNACMRECVVLHSINAAREETGPREGDVTQQLPACFAMATRKPSPTAVAKGEALVS